jgi:hypothetical protein
LYDQFMVKKITIRTLLAIPIVLLSLFCSCEGNDTLKTFSLTQGTACFSFEYRSFYKVKEYKPGEDTGIPTQDICYVSLNGPVNRQTKDYTSIDVIIEAPDDLIPNAWSNRERAERNGSSWQKYKLLGKSELTINGYPAYRIDYMHINPIPISRNLPEPPVSVYREVYFEAKGFIWMIQMISDSSTSETEKADFDHILDTFKVS